MRADTAPSRRMKILVVEDDQDNRELLARALTLMGCEVVTANDGADALAAVALAIKTEQFDLMIVDVAMRWVDGFAFVKALRCFECNDLYPKRAQIKFHTAHQNAFDNPALFTEVGVQLEDCYLKGRDADRLFADLHALTSYAH